MISTVKKFQHHPAIMNDVTFQEVLTQCQRERDDVAFVKWCAFRELVPALEPEPICKCGHRMKLQRSKKNKDGVCFRCNSCNARRSVRRDCWMAESNLTIRQLAMLLACWCSEKSITDTCELVDTNRVTVMEKFREFRDYAEQ